MKLFTTGLFVLIALAPLANADDMGRLHGYAQAPSASNKPLSLSNVIVVDDNKKLTNHGRLGAYGKLGHSHAAKRETMPVLAGMKQNKPVKNTEGLGRLNGYGETADQEDTDFFNVLDTTNMAVWH